MTLHDQARSWISVDPDPDTRRELEDLLTAGDDDSLAERFSRRLEFGTAGIRGPLGAGPARMNRVVVRRVTAGLAARLLDSDVDASRGVIVGHDARAKSGEFAADVAAVLSGAGIPVSRLPPHSPTPLVAFAVRHLGAAAGVQVTASHNPAADNGYKVYWSDGAQILAPLDAEISGAIDRVGWDAQLPMSDALVSDVGPEIADRYCEAVLPLQLGGVTDLRIIYTPLHGVAGDLLTTLLARAGFTDVVVVAEQADPDPTFPTVPFPNPEEPGALDLAIATAAHSGADLILANDPDGDRIAVAVPDGDTWRPLNGDEIGCLLAEWLLTHGRGDGPRMVATTVVSSRLLQAIAAHHGVEYAETLTGFKWLARAARDAADRGVTMTLAYEQALGAMCGTAVLDKDGLSAALVFADMAASLRAHDSSPAHVLDDLARRHGVHATGGRNVRLTGDDGPRLVSDTLQRLRRTPPIEIAGVAVVEVADHIAGHRRTASGDTVPLTTPSTPLVGITLDDRSRLQVRPSGTEPLLKFYAEVIEPVAGGEVAAARERAGQRVGMLLEEMVRRCEV